MIRFFDIFFAIIAFILLSPLLILIALILRFTGEGEVLFYQERVGLNGSSFKICKFATMLKNSEQIGTGTITIKDDPRVLPVGKLLRKSKLNELPQIINILMGDMSFIGPRPQDQRCFSAFPEDLKSIIVKVRPGLSGIGSIVFRDEEKLMELESDPEHFYDNVIMPYKAKLEVWFVENQSLLVYFKLIFITMMVVVRSSSVNVFNYFDDLPRSDIYLKQKLR